MTTPNQHGNGKVDGLRWDRIREGDESPVYRLGPVTRTDIVRYAGASGDFNPIHHDEEYAQSIGLPSVFAHGMLQAGVLSHLVEDWLGLRNLREYTVRFAARVWPGDRLQMTGRLVRKFEDQNERRVEAVFAVTDDCGEIKASASAIAAVK